MSIYQEWDFNDRDYDSQDGLVRVSLEWIGEGSSGDYDAEDPLDQPLLRFSLYRRFHDSDGDEKIANFCDGDDYQDDDWMAVQDGSYCTQLDARLPIDVLDTVGRWLLARVEDDVRSYTRKKHDWEQLSWVGIVDGQIVCETRRMVVFADAVS